LNLPLLLLASLLLFVAHVARARRAALLFPPKYLKQRFNLLLGLAIGYAVNAVIPWRVGELVRILFVSRRESIRFAYSAAVVAAERLSDIAAIVLIGIVATLAASWAVLPAEIILFGLSTLAIAVAGTWLIVRSAWFRRLIWWAGSLFNERIQFGIADFFWSSSELLRSGLLLKRRYLTATVGMWLLYFLAYITFALSIDQRAADGALLLLVTPFISSAKIVASWSDWTLLLFLGLPILSVLGWGMLTEGNFLVRLFVAHSRFSRSPLQERATTQERFFGEQEYRNFLTSLFHGEDRALSGFGLQALDDGIVHKLFNGGSDAITALVDVNGQLAIRKFATGAAAEKLEGQHAWLLSADRSTLPWVDINRQRHGDGFFLYDMPLVVPANDFFDVIHTSPIERSIALLDDICCQVAAFHASGSQGAASSDLVGRYVADKVVANATNIVDFARTMLPSQEYVLNGEVYSLAEWEPLLDPDWASRQIRERATASIHGDLTIENIIIAPETGRGWYIIDPNPGNIFDSPLIDWAKLMQSLNLGYEANNRSYNCSLAGNMILLSQTRSQGYAQLHGWFEGFLVANYGPGILQDVYFHEIVHYLRLTPYKMRQDPKKGIFFFGCASLLLRHYARKFG